MYEIIDKEIIQEFGEFLQEITEIRFETEYQKPPPDDPATKIIDTKRKSFKNRSPRIFPRRRDF